MTAKASSGYTHVQCRPSTDGINIVRKYASLSTQIQFQSGKEMWNSFAGRSLFHMSAFCWLSFWLCWGFDYILTLLGCLTEYFAAIQNFFLPYRIFCCLTKYFMLCKIFLYERWDILWCITKAQLFSNIFSDIKAILKPLRKAPYRIKCETTILDAISNSGFKL